VQGLLEALGIPYTGSKVLGSALSIDKIRSKQIWHSVGIATPQDVLWQADYQSEYYIKLLGLPLVVKPVCQGSSIAVTKVSNISQLLPACRQASKYGPVMLEPWIIGDEYTVGILGNAALPSILVTTKDVFYDYHAKYLTKDTNYICPSPLTNKEEQTIREIAVTAFHAVGASGWGRADFIRDVQGKFFLLELNTIPGMTQHSLIPKAAQVSGMSFDEVVLKILSETLTVLADNSINNETIEYGYSH